MHKYQYYDTFQESGTEADESLKARKEGHDRPWNILQIILKEAKKGEVPDRDAKRVTRNERKRLVE